MPCATRPIRVRWSASPMSSCARCGARAPSRRSTSPASSMHGLPARAILRSMRLIAELGVSARQVERLTKRIYGAPPKLLARKYRSLRAASLIGTSQLHWSEAAGDAFFDQSHFIRDFKRFTGLTPSQFQNDPPPVTRLTLAAPRDPRRDRPARADQLTRARRKSRDTEIALERAAGAVQHRRHGTRPRSRKTPTSASSGSMLGDVIRAYGGEALFRRIEYIRSTSVDRASRHRRGRCDRSGAGRADARRHARLRARLHAVLDARQSRRGPAGRRRRAGRRPRRRASSGSARRASAATRCSTLLDQCADRAGAHRAPDRGAAQEHDRPPQPHRRADAAARIAGATETDDGELVDDAIRRQIALLWQTRPLRRERLYVADEVETALAYHARHLPAGAPGALCALEARAGRARAELPAARQLDRRRSRRQPQRQRRYAALRAAPPVGGAARPLSRSAPRARRRAVDLDRTCRGHARGRGAGRGQPRPERRRAATSPIAAR